MPKGLSKEKKHKLLKETLPLFWNSYQHMYDVRERNSSSKINFLLIVATFLPLLSLGLYEIKWFRDPIILVPIIFQIAVVIYLLTSFRTSRYAPIHWIELEGENGKIFLEKMGKGEFEINFISELKMLERGTWTKLMADGKIIVVSTYFLIVSLLATLFILSEVSVYMNVLIIAIMTIIGYMLFVYKKLRKFKDMERKPEKMRQEGEEVYQTIKAWLEEKKK